MHSVSTATSLVVGACCLVLLLLGCGGDKKDAGGDNQDESNEYLYRRESVNNIRILSMALHAYLDTHGHFPPPAIMDAQGRKPLLSWRVAILPHLEQDSLFKQFRLNEPWDSEHNKRLLAHMPKAYALPGVSTGDPHMTFYQGFVGRRTIFEPGKRINVGAIKDGFAHTVLLVEASDPVPWTKPQDIPYDHTKPIPRVGKYKSGFNLALGDGSIHFLKPDPPQDIFHLAIMRDDGMVMDLEKLKK